MPETRADLSARLETASAEDLVEYLKEDNAVQAKDMTKWLVRAFQLAKSTAAASELMSYAEALLDAGYDSTMSLRGLTAAEMVSEGVKKGHATLIMAYVNDANTQQIMPSAAGSSPFASPMSASMASDATAVSQAMMSMGHMLSDTASKTSKSVAESIFEAQKMQQRAVVEATKVNNLSWDDADPAGTINVASLIDYVEQVRRKHAKVDDGVAACIDKIMQGDPGLDITALAAEMDPAADAALYRTLQATVKKTILHNYGVEQPDEFLVMASDGTDALGSAPSGVTVLYHLRAYVVMKRGYRSKGSSHRRKMYASSQMPRRGPCSQPTSMTSC